MLLTLAITLAHAQSLTVSGSCPGALTIEVSGMTPTGRYAVLSAAGSGEQVIPGGPCAGAITNLAPQGFKLRALRTADAFGEGVLTPGVPEAICGAHTQALDLETCALTNLANLNGLPTSCEQARLAGLPTGLTTLDLGDADGQIDVWCDQDTEGGGWLDLVATMHAPGADPDALLQRFFTSNGVNGTAISVGLGTETTSGRPGFHIDNDAPSLDGNQGFHLRTSYAFDAVRTEYRAQGSDMMETGYRDRCTLGGWWIPLNGPGFDGGYIDNYLSPCPEGATCTQGSPELGRDAPIHASYTSDAVERLELLTWTTALTDELSLDCARDPEIPTDHPTVFFTELRLR